MFCCVRRTGVPYHLIASCIHIKLFKKCYLLFFNHGLISNIPDEVAFRNKTYKFCVKVSVSLHSQHRNNYRPLRVSGYLLQWSVVVCSCCWSTRNKKKEKENTRSDTRFPDLVSMSICCDIYMYLSRYLSSFAVEDKVGTVLEIVSLWIVAWGWQEVHLSYQQFLDARDIPRVSSYASEVLITSTYQLFGYEWDFAAHSSPCS